MAHSRQLKEELRNKVGFSTCRPSHLRRDQRNRQNHTSGSFNLQGSRFLVLTIVTQFGLGTALVIFLPGTCLPEPA